MAKTEDSCCFSVYTYILLLQRALRVPGTHTAFSCIFLSRLGCVVGFGGLAGGLCGHARAHTRPQLLDREGMCVRSSGKHILGIFGRASIAISRVGGAGRAGDNSIIGSSFYNTDNSSMFF